jgi:hypothetical protein
MPAEHAAPPAQTNVDPQPPQLLLSTSSFTQAPLQRTYPELHANVHAPPTHAGRALATLVAQALPHALQLAALLVVSTQVPAQRVGTVDGQPDTQADPEQTGVPPLHEWPHVRQFSGSLVVSTHAPLQSVVPPMHLKLHSPFTQSALALVTFVVHT